MPQIAKPFMAALMLAKGRLRQGFRRSRHNVAATSPGIVPVAANFSRVDRRFL